MSQKLLSIDALRARTASLIALAWDSAAQRFVPRGLQASPDGALHTQSVLSNAQSKGYELQAGIRRALNLVTEFGAGAEHGTYRIDSNTETHFLFADAGAAYVCDFNKDDLGNTAKLGTDGTVAIPADDLNFGTGNFTVESWTSADEKTSAGFHRVFNMFFAGGATILAAVSESNDAPGFRLNVVADDETTLINIFQTISADVWPFGRDAIRHYVYSVTRNGASSKMEVYIDKIKVAEVAWDETGNEAKTVSFGGESARINIAGNWDGAPEHKGLLASVRLYDRALNVTQVAHRHSLGPWELGRDGVVPLLYFHSNEYSNDDDAAVVRRGDGTELAALDVSGATLNLVSWPGGDAVTRQHPRNVGNLEPNKVWVANGQWLNFYPSTDGWVTITRIG